MIKYIAVIIPAAAALLLTFLSRKIARLVFKDSGDNNILKIKTAALAIGIFAFALAVILF